MDDPSRLRFAFGAGAVLDAGAPPALTSAWVMDTRPPTIGAANFSVGRRVDVGLGGCNAALQTYGLAHTRGDQIICLPCERTLFAGVPVRERIFPYFPPADTASGSRRSWHPTSKPSTGRSGR